MTGKNICSKAGIQVAAHCQLPSLPMYWRAFVANGKYHRQACATPQFKN